MSKFLISLVLILAGSKFSKGMPSTTYSGALEPVIELPPLMTISSAFPGVPSFEVTLTPAALPAKAWSKLTVAVLARSSTLILDTEPVKSFFLTAS